MPPPLNVTSILPELLVSNSALRRSAFTLGVIVKLPSLTHDPQEFCADGVTLPSFTTDDLGALLVSGVGVVAVLFEVSIFCVGVETLLTISVSFAELAFDLVLAEVDSNVEDGLEVGLELLLSYLL